MTRRVITLLMATFLLLMNGLSAQPTQPGKADDPDIEMFRPTEEEAEKIRQMTLEYGRLEARLALLYGDLKMLGYVSHEDETLLHVRTSNLSQFEIKDSTLTDESVRIVWKAGAPDQIVFRVRTATVRGLRTIVTVFRMNSVRRGKDVAEPDIDFISLENLVSGRGNYVYYTLTKWDAPQIPDKTRAYADSGITIQFPFSQIREPSRKVEIMERLLESYRDVERHLGYLVQRSIQKELNDMGRYIPKY